MKKIAFYLHNPGLGNVDCSHLFETNPGIGGTEYEVLLVSSLLYRKSEKYEVRLYLDEPLDGLVIPFCIVSDIREAIATAESEECDVLVFKQMEEYFSADCLHSKTGKLALFPWIHIFHNRLQLDYYLKNPDIKRVVCVGKEHRDIFLDHPCNKKVTYVFNTLNTDVTYKEKVALHPYSRRGHIVTYIGSLVPEKCFHHLAAMWKEILETVPDAELYVIGSGKVYDRTKSLGSHNLAQEDFEQTFMPFLCDSNGVLLPSVHFMGNMGKDKEEILLKTKVGVPNPWGLSETFCISAVEMQLCGATVVAGACPGYYDTFINGVIVKDRKKIKDAIVKQLLMDKPVRDYDETFSFIQANFSNESVVKDWDVLLSNYELSVNVGTIKNLGYRLKWLKVVMKKLKEWVPFTEKILTVDNLIQRYESFKQYRAF